MIKRYLLLLPFLLLPLLAEAQNITWQPAQSVASASFENRHPRIVLAANGAPIVVWGNATSDNAFLSRWTGSAFSAPAKLNGNIPVFALSWAGPDIAAKGDTVYVVYKAIPEDTGSIYLRRSTDGGASFSMPMPVANFAGSQTRFPAISTDAAGQPILAVMTFNIGFTDARWVVEKSMNWGASFMSPVTACSFGGEPVCDCCPGTVLSEGNTMAMLYRNNLSNKRTSWAGISTNGGTTFPAGMEVDDKNWVISACPSSGPDGVIVGDTLYTAFMSGAGGNKVYYSKSKLSAMQGGPSVPVTGTSPNITGQNFPRIAKDGNAVAIVWAQQESGKGQVGILFANDIRKGFPTWDKAVTNPVGSSIMNADVALKNGVIHVVWEDMSSGTVMYRKGTFATTGVQAASRPPMFALTPVPANDLLQVSIADGTAAHPGRISITDLSGRVVFEEDYTQLTGHLQVSTKELADGFYILQVSSAEGCDTRKFVVRHH